MRKSVLAILLFILLVGLLAGMLSWLYARPSWELSARNTTQGLFVEIFKSDEHIPTYTTILPNESIQYDIDRARHEDLPAGVETMFVDFTVRPGRWTLVLDETKLDIMERALIINDREEIKPR